MLVCRLDSPRLLLVFVPSTSWLDWKLKVLIEKMYQDCSQIEYLAWLRVKRQIRLEIRLNWIEWKIAINTFSLPSCFPLLPLQHPPCRSPVQVEILQSYKLSFSSGIHLENSSWDMSRFSYFWQTYLWRAIIGVELHTFRPIYLWQDDPIFNSGVTVRPSALLLQKWQNLLGAFEGNHILRDITPSWILFLYD